MEPELRDPERNGGAETISVDLPSDMLAAVDAYAADAEGRPDRPTVLLRILGDWLSSNGYLRSNPVGGSLDQVEPSGS